MVNGFGKTVLFGLLLVACAFPTCASKTDSTHTAKWDSINQKMLQFYYDGKYMKAIQSGQQAEKIAKVHFGKKTNTYAEALNNLGVFYHKIGNYQKAESYYQQAKDLREQILDAHHPDYATTLSNLGTVLEQKGEYEKAVDYLHKARKIRKKVLGKDHPDYAKTLNNLGALYRTMGLHEKSEAFMRQAKNIKKAIYNENNANYALALNNLATHYQDMENYNRAETLYKKARAIYGKTLGKNHARYALAVSSLGVLYRRTGRYEKSDTLLRLALRIRAQSLGKQSPLYAHSLNNLAILYEETGRYNKADSLYHEGLTIREKALGKEHPKFTTTLLNLAGLYYQTRSYGKALDYYQRSRTKTHQQIEKMVSFLSEKGKSDYVTKVKDRFEQFASFAAEVHDALPVTKEMVYNDQLLLKVLVLSHTRDMRQAIRQEADSALISTYEEWLGLRKFLAQQYSQPRDKRTPNLDSLETAANRLEQKLVKASDKFQKERQQTRITWQQVQDTLRKNEAALEFITYRPWDGTFSDTTRYAALLVTPEAEHPHFIPLCDEHKIEPALEKDKDTREPLFINDLYSYQGGGGTLYRNLWANIEDHLSDTRTIYYSPAGRLHQLSLQAFPHPEQQYISNKYNLVRLNTTRKLVTGAPQPQYASAAMFGGIKYAYKGDTAREDTAETPSSALAMRHVPGYEHMRSMRGDFGFLKGSLQEVKAISDQIASTAETTTKTGYGATEESFKQMSGNSPKVLHISTHGFFFPDEADTAKDQGTRSGEPSFRYIEDPLLRSGLAFAGSNYTWQHGTNPHEEEDGILTAKEISNMDLSNTDLVVLSACETGLGDIKGSEGVYGLQRAFRMAGVDYLIMSLWKVPDEQTRQLMEDFYANWLSGRPIRQAFRNAQEKVAEEYPPYFWASFVLVGGGQEEAEQVNPTNYITLSWLGGGIVILLVIAIVLYRKVKNSQNPVM